jgi:predicted dehydrogenase
MSINPGEGFPAITRRGFGRSSIAATAALIAAPAMASSRPHTEQVRLAVVGCGSQGKSHLQHLQSVPQARVACVCDVDEQRMHEAATLVAGAKAESDLRRVLDDESIDGVIFATPDHWHTPGALLALEAGKHVYVEKPLSQNLREGQWLKEASQRHQRVVVHGTQARSSAGFQEAMRLLEEGLIGDVLIAKCWNWQRRRNIGRAQPTDPPPGVDYDTWVGPANWLPYQSNRFHYDWHWWHNFGCGGMGNDGIHEVDYALWGLGVDTLPNLVTAVGGKYFYDDDQEFPDTQQVTMQYDPRDGSPPKMFVYEQRLWSVNYPYNVDSGAEFFGTKGMMFISKRGKLEVRDDQKRRVEVALQNSVKSVVAENQQNWIDCITAGGTPHANVEVGHRTAATVHLGNIATMLGESLQFDPQQEKVIGNGQANKLLGRTYREQGHWGIPAMA